MNADLQEFQKTHGQQWARIVGMSSFNAGMVHLSIQALDKIRGLTDDEITKNSVTILSDLRGRLQHEHALFSLPVPEEESPTGDIKEDYVDAVDEAFAEHQRLTNQKPK